MKVKVISKYFDKEEGKYMKPETVIEVKKERAEILAGARVAEIIKENKEPK